MCDCNATGVDNPDCSATTTTRQVCQDEVIMTITTASNELVSALSFEPGIYYFISEFKLIMSDVCNILLLYFYKSKSGSVIILYSSTVSILLFSKQRFEVGGCMDSYILSDRIDTSASVAAALDENMNFMHVGNV